MPGITNYILDADHNAVPEENLLRWAEWMKSADRHIALTSVGGWNISTVFLGTDHSFGPQMGDPPILFETMIYREVKRSRRHPTGTHWLGFQARHATYAQAFRAHLIICERLVTLVRLSKRNQENLVALLAEVEIEIP